MKSLIFIILFASSLTSCQRDEKEVGGDDELDLQREQEYKPSDFSEKEFELRKK